jgi:hypothetical protein
MCSPLFLADGRGRPPGRRCEDLNGPEEPATADQRELNLESGRVLQTRNAGVFLFLPLLVKLRFDRMAIDAGYPSSKMVSASSALLALLMLKLLDKERRGHINDFNFDEALGLFAGLNILPKKSFATDYSYRTTREHQRALLRAWVAALGKVMFPAATPSQWTFIPSPTGVIQRGSIATTSHAAARPVPVSRLSLLWSKKAVVYATPTPT